MLTKLNFQIFLTIQTNKKFKIFQKYLQVQQSRGILLNEYRLFLFGY
jgi:hypothetical protein